MKPLILKDFAGLDLRRLPSRSDQRTLRKAVNLSLTLGKGWETRPGSRTIAPLDPRSKGLMATKSGRYAVAPAGQSIASTNPNVAYLYLGGGAGTETPAEDYYAEVLNTELYEAPGGGASFPYVVVRNRDGNVEHHYTEIQPSSSTDPVTTIVELPFTPSGGLLKLGSRLIAPSNEDGNVYFNAIQGGARDWTTPEDSGFIPVAKAAPQSRDVVGLTYFRQYAAIFFGDSVQLWAFDENPDNITRVENLGGIGTDHSRALANVLGDTFYLSRGGFRRLASAAVVGEREEKNLGAPVRALVDELLSAGAAPVGAWIASRSQYLCAFGNKVLALTFSRGDDEVSGWGYWEFPFSITDIIEYRGVVNVRTTDNRLVELSEDYEDDDGEPFTFEGRTQFLAKDALPYPYTFSEVAFGMEGSAEVFVYPDDRDPEWSFSLGVWEGLTSPFQRITLGTVSSSVAIGFKGTGRWQLDGLTLLFSPTEV